MNATRNSIRRAFSASPWSTQNLVVRAVRHARYRRAEVGYHHLADLSELKGEHLGLDAPAASDLLGFYRLPVRYPRADEAFWSAS